MITLIAALTLGPVVHSELLDNGAWIVAIPIPGGRSFSAQTFVRAGSVFETAETSGETHLLEHLLFADGEADKIAENVGFLLNATTYREFMRLHTPGPGSAWQAGLQSVARLFAKPAYAAAALEARVIGEEAALRRLDPDSRAYEGLVASLTSGSPWALKPGGERVALISEETLVATKSRHFTGKNVVAVVAGDFDARAALAELRRLYAALPAGEAVCPPPVPVFEAKRIAGETGRVAVAAPSPGYDDLRGYLAMELVVDALASPSRLEPHGLEARSFFGPSSTGVPVVLSFRSADGAPGLEARVTRALAGGISDDEFAVGVARLRACYGATNPDSAAIAAGLGILLTGKVPAFEAEIARLTKADVDAVAFGPASVAWSIGR